MADLGLILMNMGQIPLYRLRYSSEGLDRQRLQDATMQLQKGEIPKVVVDGDYVVLDGRHVVEAARRMSLDGLPCRELDLLEMGFGQINGLLDQLEDTTDLIRTYVALHAEPELPTVLRMSDRDGGQLVTLTERKVDVPCAIDERSLNQTVEQLRTIYRAMLDKR